MSRLAFYPDPGEQLFVSICLLLAGLVIFPFATAKGVQFVFWINEKLGLASYRMDWAEPIFRGFFAFACIFFTLVGALQLSAYVIHKVGLLEVW